MASKKSDYHHGDLRAALLDAVAQVIRKKGVAQVSLREVARDLGVSHGAPAHHFASKRALLTAFASEGFKRMAAAVRDEILRTRAPDPREQLAVMGNGYFRFSITHREYFEVMFRPDLIDADDPEYQFSSNMVFASLGEVIRQIQHAGFALDRDPDTLTIAAWAIVHGLGALWNSSRLQPRTRVSDPALLAEKVTEMFVGGVVGWPTKDPSPRGRAQKRRSPRAPESP